MVHSGFEPAAALGVNGRLGDTLKMVLLAVELTGKNHSAAPLPVPTRALAAGESQGFFLLVTLLGILSAWVAVQVNGSRPACDAPLAPQSRLRQKIEQLRSSLVRQWPNYSDPVPRALRPWIIRRAGSMSHCDRRTKSAS